jgi:CRP-like cAMP-binding protein
VTLADLLEPLPTLPLAAGATLGADEQRDVRYLFVDDGLVVLRTDDAGSARRTITCHAGPGALILPPSEHETLVALTPATLVPLSAGACAGLLALPEVASLVVEALGETLRRQQHALASLARLHHVDRVRAKLIQLARDHGRVGRDGIRLDFPLTHDLLGEMTGSARETVTRALDELQREGFVVRNGRSYSVHLTPAELGLAPV